MTDQSFETMRDAMVSNQLRTTAVNDPAVVAALRAVPRERFVPEDRRPLAYIDITLPLENGRAINTPMATGRLLTELHPQRGELALVVGAATGYSAALLTEMGLKVVALEEEPGLVAIARSAGVEVVQGPLASGCAGESPYDLILVDGAVEFVPEALIGQLAANGRLATGLIDGGVMRLALGRRSAHGFGLQPFADADMAVLPGFTRPKGFSF